MTRLRPTLAPPSASWHPHGVVFDCDGVLMDTESAWNDAQLAVGKRYGVHLSQEDQEELMGAAAPNVTQWLTHRATSAAQEAQRPAPSYHEIYQDLLGAEDRLIKGGIEPLPQAVEVVTACARHLPVAVASNSTSKILRHKMETIGLDSVLQTWVSSDDVPRAKPSPDIYQEAAARLGLNPADCLAVEDSPLGAAAAVEAGMKVLGIPHGHSLDIPCHYTATALEDPAVATLFTSWGIDLAR